jgi:hypothetical protein
LNPPPGDDDINAIASQVHWAENGAAQLVLDTQGATVTVSSNLAGHGFQLVAKGGGTLDLTGNVTGVTIVIEDGTTVNTHSVTPTEITIVSITTGAGTTPGTRKTTIAFASPEPVDVYASSDLTNWGAPIATGVSASGGPFIEDNIAASIAKRFYVLVSAGKPFPAP